MSESNERRETISDHIDEARTTAKSLAENDVIDSDAVEGSVESSGDEVHGPDDGRDVSGPDVPDTDGDDSTDVPPKSPDGDRDQPVGHAAAESQAPPA